MTHNLSHKHPQLEANADTTTMPSLVRIALFRYDLRLHDQPLLDSILNSLCEHDGVRLLPLYCFDPRQFDLSPLNGRADDLGPFEPAGTWHFKFPRGREHKRRYVICLFTSQGRYSPELWCLYRFLVESVYELQRSLRELGSDLLVRYGAPEAIVPQLVKHLQQDEDVEVEVFCQREVRAHTTIL
jgi:deoxyribodipyrimidine photo-lyase